MMDSMKTITGRRSGVPKVRDRFDPDAENEQTDAGQSILIWKTKRSGAIGNMMTIIPGWCLVCIEILIL